MTNRSPRNTLSKNANFDHSICFFFVNMSRNFISSKLLFISLKIMPTFIQLILISYNLYTKLWC